MHITVVCIIWNCRFKLQPTYLQGIINPQRKSNYNVRIWHNVHEKFTSPEALKEKLMDTFTEYVPDNIDFKIGYFGKPGNSKLWVETAEDLKAMYDSNHNDDTYTLWCDGRKENSGQSVRIPVIPIQLSLTTSEQERKKKLRQLFVPYVRNTRTNSVIPSFAFGLVCMLMEFIQI